MQVPFHYTSESLREQVAVARAGLDAIKHSNESLRRMITESNRVLREAREVLAKASRLGDVDGVILVGYQQVA